MSKVVREGSAAQIKQLRGRQKNKRPRKGKLYNADLEIIINYYAKYLKQIKHLDRFNEWLLKEMDVSKKNKKKLFRDTLNFYFTNLFKALIGRA